MRIVHISDIHIWRLILNPVHLFSKRALGVVELLAGRARRFRLERLAGVVARIKALEADHILITGDLTTTALPSEFRGARLALADLLADPQKVTIIPGNHDRYSGGSVRSHRFEETFGAFAPPGPYPWLRPLDDETAILGLDPTRAHVSARGYLPPAQLARAQELLVDPLTRPRRLIIACHYPVIAPPAFMLELALKRLSNAEEVRDWLAGIGPHLYCCGHVHAAWAFSPIELPDQLSLNAGAPLLKDPTGLRPPGFLEIHLDADTLSVSHHAWTHGSWAVFPLIENLHFFPPVARPQSVGEGG
ncbi:MAG TPA: metallophosphoesterase [Isosphaeraceae bacterium]|nr:metallophosphoesterase [Isosphaeraceae bacterium]